MNIKEFFNPDHDRKYFAKLKTDIKHNQRQKLIMYIGLLVVVTSTMLNLYTKLVNSVTLAIIWTLGYGMIYYAIWRIRKLNNKPKAKKHDSYHLNPVSLGILYFGFALPLWAYWANEQKTKQSVIDWSTLITVSIISLISVYFFIASYNKAVKEFANKFGNFLIGLNFIAFFAGFVLGWIPTFGQVSGIILNFIMFFGFAWIVTVAAPTL
jgi:hypothetical protein